MTALNGGLPPYTVALIGNDYEQGGRGRTRFDGLAPGVYMLEIRDDNGCVEERDYQVAAPDSLAIDILEDTVRLQLGQSAVLTTRFTASASTLRWSPPLGLDCLDCPNPTARPPFSTLYTVRLDDPRGCSGEDAVFVDVEIDREVWLPTGFTPNGDGRNDRFRIRTDFPDAIIRVAYFRVFDRWGGLLFEREDFPPNAPEFGWDGTKAGEPVSLGAYTYDLKIDYVDGESKQVNGIVNLIR